MALPLALLVVTLLHETGHVLEQGLWVTTCLTVDYSSNSSEAKAAERNMKCRCSCTSSHKFGNAFPCNGFSFILILLT